MAANPTTSADTLRDSLAISYTIDRELGRGGMATVFLAQDTRHERAVAVKFSTPTAPHRQLPIQAAINHASAIASALDYAHRQRIIRRDNPRYEDIVDAI